MDIVEKIQLEVDTDLFSSVVIPFVGQQISTKAQATIWERMKDNLGAVHADMIRAVEITNYRLLGLLSKKRSI